MLLHLPILVLATLSPVAVSDTVPTFDIKSAAMRADPPPMLSSA
jgi:hypothetical protein